jgi:hypothetical protein
MKHVTKQLFSIAMLVSAFAYAKDDVHGTRSVGPAYRTAFTSNGLISQAHKCCGESDTFNANFSAGFEFSHSMNKEKLAKYFTLGDTTSISFGPNAAATTEVSAVNFFLPNDHESTVTFNPKFWAMNGEFRLRVGLGELMEGVWFDVNLPIVHAKYDLGLEKSVKVAGTAAISHLMSEGEASQGTFTYADPVAALLGDKAVTDNSLVNAPLTYGKFGTAENGKKTKIGDVHIALGYDLINKDDAQLGLAVLGHINGDEVSNAKYVNTPSIGTAGRHGVGARLDGSVRLWENNETSLSAHLRADGAYIFDATVRRSFDFTANGVWSRYLLLKKRTDFETVTSIVNAINVTSLQAKIGKFGVYDVNLMLSLSHCGWEVNAGYNIGGATKEKLSKWVDTIAPSTYTFFGLTETTGVDVATDDATHAPTINIDGSNGTPGTALTAANLAAQSITNELLNQDSGLRPNTMSHRVYANLGYCYDKSEWMPTVSVGGSAEFSADNKSVRTYGVHGTMGISF